MGIGVLKRRERWPVWKTSRDNLQLENKSHRGSLSEPILNFVTTENPGQGRFNNTETPLTVGRKTCKFISGVTATPAVIATSSHRGLEEGQGGGELRLQNGPLAVRGA